MFKSPEAQREYQRTRICFVCHDVKPIDCTDNHCPSCTAYFAWRKANLPELHGERPTTAAELAEHEQRILLYRRRAEQRLPLFDQGGKERVA